MPPRHTLRRVSSRPAPDVGVGGCKTDPVADHAACVLPSLEPMPVLGLRLQRSDHALGHAVLLRAVGVMNSCLRPQLRTRRVYARLVKTSPLSDRSRNGVCTRLSVPKRVIRACSWPAAAVVALPLRESRQPSNFRVWQSMTKANVSQPSRPPQTRHKSVDQR